MRLSLLLILQVSALANANSTDKKSDTSAVIKMVETGRNFQRTGDIDSAEFYFRKAGSLAEKIGYDNGRLLYAGHYGIFLYEQIRYSEALAIAEQALAIATRLDNKARMAAAYNTISLQHQAQGKLRMAAENLMTALEISSGIKSPVQKDLSDRRKYYNNLSSLLMDMKDNDKGFTYAVKAFEIARQLNDTIGMGRSLVNMTVAEVLRGKLAEAELHGIDLLKIGQAKNDKQMEFQAYNNLSDIYRRQKRFPLALDTYQKALALIPVTPPGNEIYALTGISSVYKDMKQYKLADAYYSKAAILAEEELAKPQLKDLILSGAEIKEAIGDYPLALQLRKRYEILNDSLLSHESRSAIQELEMRYQTAEKEKALAERDLRISLQKSELEKKNRWIILSLSAVTVLVLIIVFNRLIRIQRKKTEASLQANRLLEAHLKGEETERGRTARELHDGVASVLSAAKLQLHTLPVKPNDSGNLTELIDIAMQEIRNISHNLAPEMVLTEGFEYAVQAFCTRIRQPGLNLECYVMPPLPNLSKQTELLLYRIIQEAVNNIIRHADASEAIVQVVGEGSRLTITIEDNGKGFDYNKSRHGTGLKNLASRMQLINGLFEISSESGKGTSLYLEIDTSKNV